MFIKKLEEVEIPPNTEPLCNVLEYYGGNQEKMRKTEEDFDCDSEINIQQEIKKMNKNMQGSLVKTPKPFERNVVN